MTYERLIADSFYEEPVTLDEPREYAWHERPRCETCKGQAELRVPALGFGVGEEWVACPDCEDGYTGSET